MNKVDHPVIIAEQIVLAIALFRLYFAVHRSWFPLPQIVGGLAIAVLVNLEARANTEPWFYITDMVMYFLWPASVIASIYSVLRRIREAAAVPGAKIIIPDFFDKVQIRATWALGIVVGGFFVFYVARLYMRLDAAKANAVVAAVTADKKATERFTQAQEKSQDKVDSLLTVVSSLSAGQGTILNTLHANKQAVLTSNSNLSRQMAKQSKEVKKTLQTTVTNVRPAPAPKPKTEEKKDDEKRNLWQRAKGLFHARRDTVGINYFEPDTLTYK